MKKNNVLKALGAVAIAGSVALFAACSNTQTNEAPVNQASGSQLTTRAAESSISLDKAIEIALAHAGVSRDNASFTKTQLDGDDAVPNYEIEFIADGVEYDYEVAVSDGKILRSETERPDSRPSTDVTAKNFDSSDTAKRTAPPSENPGYISVDAAKAAALKDAGVSASDAVFEKAEFDVDDLIPHYDIEFYADGYEYDYEINAKNYNVIEKSKEKERDAKSPTQGSEFIGADAAKEKAYAHAGVNTADVKRSQAELDRDDAIPHYEIEFVAGNFEYEYEINAKTGSVIASEKDYKD